MTTISKSWISACARMTTTEDGVSHHFRERKTGSATISAAQHLLGSDYKVAGTPYWFYQGETAGDRRRRFNGED